MAARQRRFERSNSLRISGVRSARPLIVVYERNPLARNALAALLTDDGFSVRDCARPEQVLEAARTGRPIAAFLLDLSGGVELAEAVRRLQRDVRVLFMSTGVDVANDLGERIVLKPIDFRVIQALLQDVSKNSTRMTGSFQC